MLNHEFPPVGGGASPVSFELSKELIRMGHRVDVVTMHYGDLPRFETVEGINIYITPAIRKRPNICYTHELATYLPGAMIKTIRLARREKYDIIHCHFIIPGGLLAWIVSKVTKIPFLITCHGSDVPGYNPDRFGLIHKLLLPAWRILVSRTSLLTSPSQYLKRLILQNHPDANVTVVPNGIYTDQFDRVPKEKSILMCSRILPRKGFQYAIEALRDMELDWQVHVVGEGPYLPALKRLARDSKTPIKFWGWLDKSHSRYYELFNKSSIFIFPSEAESFGMVMAEAMAAGNAIIASNIPAHREVLGNAGLLVEVRNVEQIRKQLQRLIEDEHLRQELEEKARLRVSEMFAWEVVAQKYVDCYELVLAAEK